MAAFDPRDSLHAPSTDFLRITARRRVDLHAPAFLLVEVACALARRASDPAVGAQAEERLRNHPALRLHPIDDTLLGMARDLGSTQLLRGADALYAATAKIAAAPLVTWDQELVDRAGGVTPDGWLAANG